MGVGGWGGAKVWRNKGKPSLMHTNDIKLDKFLRGMVNIARGERGNAP